MNCRETPATAMLAAGRGDAALGLLSESVRLNAAAGSIQGLQANERTLATLAEAVQPDPSGAMHPQLQRLATQLARARQALESRA